MKWVLVVAVLAVVAAGWWGVQRYRAAASEAGPVGQTLAVTRGSVEKRVESAGKVVAHMEIDIKCRASGEVIRLPFDISDPVREGDLLCQLDPTDEELALRSAEATLAQATARLAQARATLEQSEQNLITTRQRNEAALASARVRYANAQAKADRLKQLIDQQLGSQEEYETAQTDAAAALAEQRAAEVAIEELRQQEIDLDLKRQDVQLAETEVESARIALEVQQQQLGYTTVTSPIDGVVSSLNVQKGTIIASGINAVDGGTTIMTLADLSRIFVMANVDESDIGGIRVGQAARITVDSFPGQTFTGEVVRVAVKGVNESNVVTFEVKVEVLDEQKGLLKPEMTGNVTIIEAQREGVLLVPNTAVTKRASETLVTLASGEKRAITLGIQGEEHAEVIDGLAEGDLILVNSEDPASRWRSEGGPPPPPRG